MRRRIVRKAERRDRQVEEPVPEEVPTIVGERTIVVEPMPPTMTIPGRDHYYSSSSSRQRLNDKEWEAARRRGRVPRVRVDDQDFLPGVPEHLLDPPSDTAVPGQ